MSQTPPEQQGSAEPQSPPPAYPTPPAYGQPTASALPPGYGPGGYPTPPAYGQPTASALPPGYGQGAYPPPPAYGQPPYYSAQQSQFQGLSPDSRNVLGILSLVAPFVGFSAVGVVLGHLGLSAVKKGTANNRGVALAGTIISWVVTVVFVLLVIASVAIPIYLSTRTDRLTGGTSDIVLRADLKNVQVAVESYLVDNGQPPSVGFDGRDYIVGDAVLPAASAVTGAEIFSTGATTYCLEIRHDGGLVRSIDSDNTYGYGC